MNSNLCLLFAALSSLLLAGCLQSPVASPTPKSFHSHADLLVVLNAQTFNFSASKYSEPIACGKPGEPKEGSPLHLHNNVGWVIHDERENATWRDFFEGDKINFKLNASCITTDAGASFCTNATYSLRFFVNGQLVSDLAPQLPRDLDRVLVLYGPADENPAPYLERVTSDACVYSEKCAPKDGLTLTNENCAS